jgi:hypothetical protein
MTRDGQNTVMHAHNSNCCRPADRQEQQPIRYDENIVYVPITGRMYGKQQAFRRQGRLLQNATSRLMNRLEALKFNRPPAHGIAFKPILNFKIERSEGTRQALWALAAARLATLSTLSLAVAQAVCGAAGAANGNFTNNQTKILKKFSTKSPRSSRR